MSSPCSKVALCMSVTFDSLVSSVVEVVQRITAEIQLDSPDGHMLQIFSGPYYDRTVKITCAIAF